MHNIIIFMHNILSKLHVSNLSYNAVCSQFDCMLATAISGDGITWSSCIVGQMVGSVSTVIFLSLFEVFQHNYCDYLCWRSASRRILHTIMWSCTLIFDYLLYMLYP